MGIDFRDFCKVDIRAGTIIRAEPSAKAHKPAYLMWLDFGKKLGVRKTSAQLTDNYKCGSLIGKQVCAVVNLKPKQIGAFVSEVLILGFEDLDGGITLIYPEKTVCNGSQLF